jgi:hypothetical protein
MAAGDWQVIYTEIAKGFNPQQVKESAARLFKADKEKIDRLFSAPQQIIRRNIDQQTAKRYAATLLEIGMICRTQEGTKAETEAGTITQSAENSQQESKAIENNPGLEGVTLIAEWSEIEQIGEQRSVVKAMPQAELAAATVAKPGAEILPPTEDTPAPELDLSAYRLDPPGMTLVAAKEVVERQVDTSRLDTLSDWETLEEINK